MFDKLTHINKNELQEILKKHEEWLESGYKKGERANLSGAKLSYINLSGANLSGAKLREANLSGTDLSKAKLSDADLREADLSKAKLSDAYLRKANLIEANLTEADLREADIHNATFSNANLERANFQQVKCISIGNWAGAQCHGTIMDGYLYQKLQNDLKEKYKDTLVVNNVIVDQEGVNAFFEFPEDIRTACEEYLMYFRQFLKDQALTAEVMVKNEGKSTLFSVKPSDRGEALEKVQEALGIYLNLPQASESDLKVLEETNFKQHMALVRLKQKCQMFKSQAEVFQSEANTLKELVKTKEEVVRAKQQTIDIVQHDLKLILSYSLQYVKIHGKQQNRQSFLATVAQKVAAPALKRIVDKSLKALPEA